MRISIADREIGRDRPPFIIAEMSGNHRGSLDRALAIVDAAAKAGVDALKLQTYTPDTMTIDVREGPFVVEAANSQWGGRSLYDLYEEAHTPWEWHGEIFARCREAGIICFSTAFDDTAVDFLEELEVPVHKIASFENCHLPLIRKVAATGKPLIMSTGMASRAELEESVAAARSAGCEEIVLLKCVSAYPAEPRDMNLKTIPDIRDRFGVEVGLSDHTLDTGVSVAAVALGAVAIEKHFTLSREEGGVDAAFSVEPDEMAELVKETRSVWEGLGSVAYGVTAGEKGSVGFRRSVYAVKDIKEGEVLDGECIRVIRPGYGLAPKHYDSLLGSAAARDIARGTPMSWDLVRR
ncbi:pseudaminic acid synthase [Verrucomicrobiota bacterium]